MNKINKTLLALTTGALFIGGCSHKPTYESASAAEPLQQSLTDPANLKSTVDSARVISESKKANQLFDEIYQENLMASPMGQTYMGIKQDYDKWDDISDAQAQQNHKKNIADLARLSLINPEYLDTQTKLSYTLFKNRLNDDINDHQWRFHNYPVNQMYGMHSQAVSFLINAHRITDVADAHAYIARLNGLKPLMLQVTESLRIREEKGIMAPHFVFDYVINDSVNIIKGQPFNAGKDSPLLADFKKKISGLDLPNSELKALEDKAKQALLANVKPGYSTLISYLREQQSRATYDDGAWKLPQGADFYKRALQNTTTTDMSANEIHELGLNEVTRIHNEMREIMHKVGFKGDLNEFFAFMRTDEQFYFENTEEGRLAYLSQATGFIDQMRERLDELFIVKPKADLEVKRVEAFREKSAGKAFYNRPAPDGSRPGTYYANLYDMKNMPKYQMEALAFHEGIPGHHMQLAISMELENIPKFRKFGHYTAYSEGWGLYTELLPKEIGFYQDPYSDFGRLAMELWRACRLVVDTGLHEKRWTREQAIDYLAQNTPNPQGDVIKAIERYIVMPSQATAYKIGMIKILSLREHAKEQLGEKFSIREFHDIILKNGPVPLYILEQQINAYIKTKK
ncbi:DUF885 family protein [Psychrobium sp. 1_MG-2023]|uniref:DUF885 domain-containing protein n=1 Tax=Psychrobium sp. 1_MG-2023 TaxID=3062624 RepID=UPI000C34240E|nr:DUF885 domain-containing protein [Psychrobium sp. 1_MG-2023]MDP2562366.1 DUF885 domain-containing protein [Psychrobium sp. 1_MG-2023]PKF55868.1 DUF885 domain-containing protein [Alteromonadales bacterium alter-6D02]